jgi:predicted ATPase/DNA-binding CsgD family transcriptional regulator
MLDREHSPLRACSFTWLLDSCAPKPQNDISASYNPSRGCRGVMMTTIRPISSIPTRHPVYGGHQDEPAAHLGPILGREHELAQIIETIDRDNVRLVTLLGPGGVGKTRLAREVLRTMMGAFAHGARFTALDAIRDPALVPAAVARSLGLQESDARSAENLLADYLNDRHMLLVLDNMEQVIAAASPWLSGLLRQAPRLTVLVTSRIPLNIDGEHQYLVPSLETPDTDAGTSAAVHLFAERAGEVRHDFALNDENLGVVAEICRSLDGLPLAIELAAARMNVLSPDALLARLTNRLALLTGGHRDAPPRLRSMRDAIAWSYDLLSSAEQRLFRRLSVFLGGFTLDAVEFVAAWPDPPGSDSAALDLLQSLVNQSLIRVAPDDAQSRYRMLETIREFGIETAHRANDTDVFAARADFLLHLAAQAEKELMGPDQGAWNDRLEAEYANIRAAVDWLEEEDRLDDAIAIYAQVVAFIYVRGYTRETLERLQRWLDLPALAARTVSRGRLLSTIGMLMHNTGEFHRGIPILEEAVDIFLDAGDPYHAAISKTYLGVLLTYNEQRDLAVPVLENAAEMARTTGHHRALSTALVMIALAEWVLDIHNRYRALAREAYGIAQSHGDLWMMARALLVPIFDALENGRLDEGEQLVRQSMRLRTEIGSRRDLPVDWLQLAWISWSRGDEEQADDYLSHAILLAEETGHSWYRSLISQQAGIVAARRKDPVRSRALLEIALRAFETHHRVDNLAQTMAAYAVLASTCGDDVDAARFLGAAEALAPDPDGGRPDPGVGVHAWVPRPKIGAALPAQEFAQAYDVGAAWTMDEAISKALRYVPPATPAQDVAEETPAPGGLSPRELDVLAHMANGMSNRQIADALFVSHRTVTTHVTHIMTKLDVPSRTAAVSFAIRNGIA